MGVRSDRGHPGRADRPSLGRFKLRDGRRATRCGQRIYLAEDQPDGLIYRYTPLPGREGVGPHALEGGSVEAMRPWASGGATTWLPVPERRRAARRAALTSVAGATPFDGGEGCLYDEDRIYITTKGDDRVWVHDIVAADHDRPLRRLRRARPVLNGVDNIAVSAAHDLYVAEDGGNLEVCMITPDGVVAAVVEMTGAQQGDHLAGTPLPLVVGGDRPGPVARRKPPLLLLERGLGLLDLPIGPGPG